MWPFIHMMPEEMVQAAVELQAKKILPVHWGKFRLSMHPWNEPVKRVIKKAGELNIPVLTPRIGEPVLLDQHFSGTSWWEM
jgi:L-ascorbate metabolism protein UlaG (beta-lactamase superfamily)